MQLDLFENPQLSRQTDPVTSHEAGDEIRPKLGIYHERCLSVLGNLELTARELAMRCVERFGGDSETYRKRMKELVDAKEITTRDPRRCSITGKSATIYRKVSL
jgi:hypothetical protein